MKNILLCITLVGCLSAQDTGHKPTGIKLPNNFADIAKQQNRRANKSLSNINKMLKAMGPIVDAEGNVVAPPPPKAYCSVGDSQYDARLLHFVSPVKDQGTCGSCWAFSTVANIESAELINGQQVAPLSEQELLACSGNNNSCDGGSFPYDWVLDHGMTSGNILKYDPTNVSQTQCTGWSPVARIKVAGYIRENGDIEPNLGQRVQELKAALCQYGTLSVMMAATDSLQWVGTGAYSNNAPEQNPITEVNHAVQLIGWDDAKRAWIIKNSWGVDRGDQGFFLIQYGSSWFGFAASWTIALEPQFFLDSKGKLRLNGSFMKLKDYKNAQSNK